MKNIIVLLGVVLSLTSFAAEKPKANNCDKIILSSEELPKDWVDGILGQLASDSPVLQRLRTAVQEKGLKAASINRDLIREHSDDYTFELNCGKITNQKQSGRCWMFAFLKTLRAEMIATREGMKNFEFSQNYLHFFNMLEKSNAALEEAIAVIADVGANYTESKFFRHRLMNWYMGDGGYSFYNTYLITKYGLVPKSAMPESISSSATRVLAEELLREIKLAINQMLPEEGQTTTVETMREVKDVTMRRIAKILDAHLGRPPTAFKYREPKKAEKVAKKKKSKKTKVVSGRKIAKNKAKAKEKAKSKEMEKRVEKNPVVLKTYTPLEFAKDYVGFNGSDYVHIQSLPYRETGKVFERRESAIGRGKPTDGDHYNLRYLNVSRERLEALVVKTLKDGRPVYFAAVMGLNVDNETGIMHPDIEKREDVYGFNASETHGKEITFDREFYLQMRESNHAMVFTGFDQPNPDGEIVKFKVDNSWGTDPGTKGVYHMYMPWFRKNVSGILIHKRYLSKTETKTWESGESEEIGREWYDFED